MQNYIDAANQFRLQAFQAVVDRDAARAIRLFEMAFSSAMMAGDLLMPMRFALFSKATLPMPLAAVEHVLVQMSQGSVFFIADFDLVSHPITEFSRFPMVGKFFADLARELPPGQTFGCVVDLGDGDDRGDYPRIAYSSARSDAVLVPDPFLHMSENYAEVRDYAAHRARPWQERQDLVFWRGTAGGRILAPLPEGDFDIHDPNNWRWVQRLHLCSVSRNSRYGDHLDVGLTKFHQIEQQSMRERLVAAGFVRAELNKARFFDYKYLIDIDGWSNAWSLLDKLIMGAVVLKVESGLGYRQWYYDRLIPWRHYIPIAADLSDFDERIGWALSHSDDCAEIAANAAAFGESIQLEPELAAARQRVKMILQPIVG